MLGNEEFFAIRDYDHMDPFFMTIVSHSDHWMFIASNGGLSAGRKNENNALFPYYTDDKIVSSAHLTGSYTAFRVPYGEGEAYWQPFLDKYEGAYNLKRTLYKSKWGNKIVFEEKNKDLQLTYRYGWSFSQKFGFVKTSRLINDADREVAVEVLDGVQNLIPFGISSSMQNNRSNLANAYKRSELHKESGVGVFALSAMIIDRAEPSEALKATSCWSAGLEPSNYLLSVQQLQDFLHGKTLRTEEDIKALPGAYILHSKIRLEVGQSRDWQVVAEINQSQPQVRNLMHRLLETPDKLADELYEDVEKGTLALKAKVAKADGLQLTGDQMMVGRHYSNVLYNIMRGGIFDEDYRIEIADFAEYFQQHNRSLFILFSDFISGLGQEIQYQDLVKKVRQINDPDLIRLTIEYLPLSFSRRHGDPSRPWNKFSIQLQKENGDKERYYQGNWRDIFQNWEALALSYPAFITGMIYKFVNATTADGYNPYRISRDGIDWEEIEPDDPWSYIGYWGDHQMIYLQKLLEIINDHYPGKMSDMFTERNFVYANVPYRIKSFDDIASDPKNTVDFDPGISQSTRNLAVEAGADGKLLLEQMEDVRPLKANFIEKLLTTLLTKIYNYVPDAGIWLNTQRPEWNDANNALVGNGCSMVTLYYMRRFTNFLIGVLDGQSSERYEINLPLHQLFERESVILSDFTEKRKASFSNQERGDFTFKMGQAGEAYREAVYQQRLKERVVLEKNALLGFLRSFLEYADQAIDNNKRKDGLFHAYNLIAIQESEIEISYLYEMLEGQVAVLSSGYLSPREALDVLDALKDSRMFREDQYSYLLYPNRAIPGFLERNHPDAQAVEEIPLVQGMVAKGNTRVIEKDRAGYYYFNGSIHNANDLIDRLNSIQEEGVEVPSEDRSRLLAVFEETFDHKSFTGRSGTFFGYEGLGSIYWHMVSKLLLATQEVLVQALDIAGDDVIGRLTDHYYEIRAGIGINKSPELYGAFPSDPYSHTPFHKGAQQPGMTGQVKEDILNRWAELGVKVSEGRLGFSPAFLSDKEWIREPSVFEYYDGSGRWKEIQLSEGELAFTYCQIPIIYRKENQSSIVVHYVDGRIENLKDAKSLDRETTASIFDRHFDIKQIVVNLKRS